MDSSRFDEFTKFLARRPSRRQVLKGMLASAFGGSLADLENAFATACSTIPSLGRLTRPNPRMRL